MLAISRFQSQLTDFPMYRLAEVEVAALYPRIREVEDSVLHTSGTLPIPRYAVRAVQRPGDVSAANGKSAEGIDVEDVPRLSRRRHRLRVHYLGHVVTQHGIGTDPEKTAAVQKWPTPQCVREVRQFLGLASYYRRFVSYFAGVVNPLHALTKKGEKWLWRLKEEVTFTRLKEALVSPPILGHPDFDRTFLLDVDESEDAVRAVLSQQGGQDPPAVIAYASRSLPRAERGYCATRREMLSLVWATQHFRLYLYDGCGTFENRQDLEQLYEAVWGRKSSEQQRQKFWKDRKAHGPVYEPGDQKKLDWNTYRVKEMKGRRRRLVVHFDRLNPYHAPSEREGAWGKQRDRRKTRRPAWLQDFIQTQEVSTGRALHEGESSAADMDRVNEISPAENEEEEN
ncbi:Retrovirus-related Pol polyprotein from transposon opus [Trichinella sp. T8]|nr:Retrovirus-related Pol polyprotein from transposon opus [Trichinella sp. T8]